jgi:predicted outer membrane protein
MILPIALSVVLAQATPMTPAPAAMQQNEAPGIDRTFALAVIQGDNAEREMAALADRRSSVPEVRQFAHKMTTEHAGLADALMPDVMRVRGSAPPDSMTAPDQLALAHLQTISEVDFDQTYATQQVGDHVEMLTVFRTEADSGSDQRLRVLARKWLPTIESHLELAVALARHIGGSSALR